MRINRRAFLKRASAAGFFAALSGTGYSTLVEPHRIAVEKVTVRIPKLPTSIEGFRIAVMSDFHLEPFTKLSFIERAIRLANELEPDAIALLGDFVDATAETIRDLAPALGKLNARHGVFAVLGNHDHWMGAKLVASELQRSGIELLHNRGVHLGVDGSSLFLAGIDSAWAGHPDVTAALAHRQSRVPTIALLHEPDYADQIAGRGQIDLQLSGHSHGGQVRLPLVGALRLPSWGRRYDCGLYQIKDLALYTTRGVGLVGYPVRFNCPPEVTEITLASA